MEFRQIIKFLDVYERFECLWDSDYMNSNKRDVALRELAKALIKEEVLPIL